MQKNYRDFTVGELLDLGLNVEVKKHFVETIDEAVAITKMFEGTKQSTSHLTANLITARAWKERFEVIGFVRII